MSQPSTSPRPQDLIISVFAMYGRATVGGAGSIAASELIRLMADLGVDEPAVRSVLSRMRKRGTVQSAKKRGLAAYELNPSLEDVFAEGDERIFGQQRSRAGQAWLLAAFSVPESERHLRHQIRSMLIKRGFGTVTAGLWIAPQSTATHLRAELARAGLLQHVELFCASYLDDGAMTAKIAQWWDLPALAELYRTFLAEYRAVHRRWSRAKALDPSAAFADYVPLVTRWRRLPFADPGLPAEYLPRNWPGLAAERVFGELHERLCGPARTYANHVVAR